MEVSIITGCYNEGNNLDNFIESVLATMNNLKIEDFEIIIVDESDDQFTKWKLGYFGSFDRIRVITNDERKGLLASEMEGITKARGRMKIVMDCDMQHNPKYIHNIITYLSSEKRCVVMSRFVEGGSNEMSRYRYVLSKLAGIVSRIMIPPARHLKDPTSGFYGISGDIKKLIPNFHATKSLLFLISLNPEIKIEEIPYHFNARYEGKSRIMAPSIFLSFIREIIYFRSIYNQEKEKFPSQKTRGLIRSKSHSQKL